nr:PREDICTED: flocculation protein FLO11-like [Stegastes partitus]
MDSLQELSQSVLQLTAQMSTLAAPSQSASATTRPSRYNSDKAKIAFCVNLLRGRAAQWATSLWKKQSSILTHHNPTEPGHCDSREPLPGGRSRRRRGSRWRHALPLPSAKTSPLPNVAEVPPLPPHRSCILAIPGRVDAATEPVPAPVPGLVDAATEPVPVPGWVATATDPVPVPGRVNAATEPVPVPVAGRVDTVTEPVPAPVPGRVDAATEPVPVPGQVNAATKPIPDPVPVLQRINTASVPVLEWVDAASDPVSRRVDAASDPVLEQVDTAFDPVSGRVDTASDPVSEWADAVSRCWDLPEWDDSPAGREHCPGLSCS